MQKPRVCRSIQRSRLNFERLENRYMLAAALVNTTLDVVDLNDGVTSLREAIFAANTLNGPDTINFAPALTASSPAHIVLTMGELKITDDLTINGPGFKLLTIDASGDDTTPGKVDGLGSRIFNVESTISGSPIHVDINNLTLTGGDVSGNGGAVLSSGILDLTACHVTRNAANPYFDTSDPFIALIVAGSGGGIANVGGDLHVANCVIDANTFGSYRKGPGGGIMSIGGALSVTSSQIANNTESSGGGGIFVANGTASITDCQVIGNSNDSSVIATTYGGGIMAIDVNLTVSNTTLAQNFYVRRGGGIYSERGSLVISQSTLDDNSVEGSGLGGGIYRNGDPNTSRTLISFSTITNNGGVGFGGGYGGGVYATGGGAFQLDHSIVSQNGTIYVLDPNTHQAKRLDDDLAGPVSARYCLIGNSDGAMITNQGGNLIGKFPNQLDPLIGGLVANGGTEFLDGSQMLTVALLPDSPAINAGDSSAVAGLNGVPQFDQRGSSWSRVSGGRIDIGAFESQPNPLAGDYDFDRVVDAADYVLYRKSLGSTTDLRADGNASGTVDPPDFSSWRTHFGTVLQTNAATGDYNSNTAVDASDYVIWRKTLGSATNLRADGEGNGVVDSADYTYWRARFGNVLASGSALTDADGANSGLATISQSSPALLRKSLVSGGSDLFSVVAPTFQPSIRVQFHSPNLAALSSSSTQPNETNQPTAAWLQSPMHLDWGIQDTLQEGRAADAGTTNTEAWQFSLVDRAFDQLAGTCKLETTAAAIAVQL